MIRPSGSFLGEKRKNYNKSLIKYSEFANNVATAYRVWFDQDSRFQRQLLFSLNIVTNVTQFLFQLANRFEIGGVIESVTSQKEKLWKTKFNTQII